MKNLVGYEVDITFGGNEVLFYGIVLSQTDEYYMIKYEGLLVDMTREEFNIDMFKNERFLPDNVKGIIERYDLSDLSKKKGYKFQKELKKSGYKFDWDADGSPTYLRKRKKKKKKTI